MSTLTVDQKRSLLRLPTATDGDLDTDDKRVLVGVLFAVVLPPLPPPALLPVSARPSLYAIYVFDAAGARQGEVDDFTYLEVHQRFCDVGSWELRVPGTSPQLANLLADQATVQFVRDGVEMLSGPVSRKGHSYDAQADRVTLFGTDDAVWLARRLCSPDPASGLGTAGAAYDVRGGPASTVISGYVDANAGPSAVAARRVLTVAVDPAIGAALSFGARYQSVLVICQFGARLGGIGFKVIDREFSCFAPVDRSGSVMFSVELGNLAEFDYTAEAPEANHAVVAGGGEGVARVIVDDGDAASIAAWGRIETFVDRRDTTDLDELADEVAATLTAKAARTAVKATPTDSPSLAWLTHWNVGDLVTVTIDGLRLVDTITEVTVTVDDNGERVVPGVGNADALAPLRLFSQLRDLDRRTRNLEAAP